MFPSALAWSKARAILWCLDLKKIQDTGIKYSEPYNWSDFIINAAFFYIWNVSVVGNVVTSALRQSHVTASQPHTVHCCNTSVLPPPKQQRRHEQELLLLGQRQRGGARHSGAPMLRRHAATSSLLRSMAYLSAVLKILQGRW
jgi:hypothetical protein